MALDDSPSLDFATYFEAVEDPRIDRHKRHRLLDIIGLTICAVIAGADTFVAIERFGHARKPWLTRFLALEGGIPSHDTLGRVWSRIDPEEFETGFRRWIAALIQQIGGVVAVDGKTLRRSHDQAASGKEPLQMISAWACENRLVLGQQAVPEATNETGTLPRLLRTLVLEGAIVTVDAAGCFEEVVEAIVDQSADYVITLKCNQGELYRDAEAMFERIDAQASPAQGYTSVDGGHGRVEIRRCLAVEVEGRGLVDTGRWPGLRSICKVRSERHRADGTDPEVEERLFISSLAADPERLLKAVRSHWHVENKLHWTLDVAFGEDDRRMRTGDAAQNMAVVRRLALNLLKQETSRSEGIQTKRMEAAWNPDYLLKVLTAAD